ncbi:hypothetical protein ACV3ZD_12480 [Clostridium perfringens]|uniref:hypothetical protein n=1 Tax=Clostridium perfringens TaxID=1502 RepID=UPI001CAF1A26|nr:hypothetical protein [Clostridium perfringens]MCC2764358.1 hypothetical protein [Clostridium perfringens]MCG4541009.1 hypothetical protein [Clostridium perfringens]MCG4543472.1 hypothetical protein [Clostridium perfringens]MCG4552579.1 hypothetical protein [Clostridium perfringens]MCG4555531.1 hypothetical protein [Clostridium perfringens]
MSLKRNIYSLDRLIKLFEEFEMVECLDVDINLLKDVKSDLEEFLRVKEENKLLKEQLELYKLENEGLKHAYIEKIRGEIANE